MQFMFIDKWDCIVACLGVDTRKEYSLQKVHARHGDATHAQWQQLCHSQFIRVEEGLDSGGGREGAGSGFWNIPTSLMTLKESRPNG
jgi:hypothetical protein